MRRTENDWMRGISKYVCNVFLVCSSIETAIMFFVSPVLLLIRDHHPVLLLPCFFSSIKTFFSQVCHIVLPRQLQENNLGQVTFSKKKFKIIFIQCTLSSTYLSIIIKNFLFYSKMFEPTIL